MDEKLKSIGMRIKALRTGKNLPQLNVANFLIVTRPTLSKIEHSEIIPTVKHIIKLTELFQVSVEYLITGKQVIQIPDFQGMNAKVFQMLDHMAKNEALFHYILSQYFAKKEELALYAQGKEREKREEKND